MQLIILIRFKHKYEQSKERSQITLTHKKRRQPEMPSPLIKHNRMQNTAFKQKEKIIADLYAILFTTDYTSAPDSFDLNVYMAKCLLTHHKLHFKELNEIPGSEYWQSDIEVSYHFFDFICPGKVLNEIQFANVCDEYFDFDLFIGTYSATNTFSDIERLLNTVAKDYKPYEVIAIAGTANQLISSPQLKPAA